MPDFVRPLKLENPSDGGTEFDSFPTEVDPNEDYTQVGGVALVDQNTTITKDTNDNMRFNDANTPQQTLRGMSIQTTIAIAIALG